MLLFDCRLCGLLSDDGDIPNMLCMGCADGLAARRITQGKFFIRNRDGEFLRVKICTKIPELSFVESPKQARFFEHVEEAREYIEILGDEAGQGAEIKYL